MQYWFCHDVKLGLTQNLTKKKLNATVGCIKYYQPYIYRLQGFHVLVSL